MKKAKARFTPESAKLIASLPPEIKKLVRSSIDTLLVKPRSGTELTGELQGYRSLKAKRYRIIYRVNDSETSVEIYLVGLDEMFMTLSGPCCSRSDNNLTLIQIFTRRVSFKS